MFQRRVCAQVCAQLKGHLPLPWEGQLPEAISSQLGSLQRPILRLLQRDPASRSSMHQFHDECMWIMHEHSGNQYMPAI
jgi:hypothetical protein